MFKIRIHIITFLNLKVMRTNFAKILLIVFFMMQTALYAQTIIVTDDSTYTTSNSPVILEIKFNFK